MTDFNLEFQTRALHGNGSFKNSHDNAIRFPVFAGVAFDFDNAEVFQVDGIIHSFCGDDEGW